MTEYNLSGGWFLKTRKKNLSQICTISQTLGFKNLSRVHAYECCLCKHDLVNVSSDMRILIHAFERNMTYNGSCIWCGI